MFFFSLHCCSRFTAVLLDHDQIKISKNGKSQHRKDSQAIIVGRTAWKHRYNSLIVCQLLAPQQAVQRGRDLVEITFRCQQSHMCVLNINIKRPAKSTHLLYNHLFDSPLKLQCSVRYKQHRPILNWEQHDCFSPKSCKRIFHINLSKTLAEKCCDVTWYLHMLGRKHDAKHFNIFNILSSTLLYFALPSQFP